MSAPLLSGKTALVTGGCRGLGLAMAEALAAAGASLILVARSQESFGGVKWEGARTLAADVSREEEVSRLFQEAGPVDILVNNAGSHLRKSLEEISLQDWNAVLDSNLTSAFLMCRAFAPAMAERGYGRIVNISSVTSLTAGPARAAYAAAKAGLLGLTRALALELAPHGITVNSVSPGTFPTRMNAPLLSDPEVSSRFLERIPVRRWGRPEEVGSLVCHLCLPQSGFITGADLLIDGGWRAQ